MRHLVPELGERPVLISGRGDVLQVGPEGERKGTKIGHNYDRVISIPWVQVSIPWVQVSILRNRNTPLSALCTQGGHGIHGDM